MDDHVNIEMTARDVLELVGLFKGGDIDVTIDGGWAVDAHLGYQTRTHLDLDIAIPYVQVKKLRELLEANGFFDVPRPDTRECNFVMGDRRGRQVDIHTYTPDLKNHPEQGCDYPLDSFNGVGNIMGLPVGCINVERLVEFHTGYEVDETDYRDTKALCQQFGIPLPADFQKFEASEP